MGEKDKTFVFFSCDNGYHLGRSTARAFTHTPYPHTALTLHCTHTPYSRYTVPTHRTHAIHMYPFHRPTPPPPRQTRSVPARY
jgi:hypothetical protein